MQYGRLLARTILPLAIASFVAAGCDGSPIGAGGVPDDAVCAVDGTAIPQKEFNRMFGNAEQQYKDNGRDFPKKGAKEYDSLRSDLVEYLVQQKLIENQANKFNLSASNKEVEKGVKDLKKQVAQGDEKKFKEEMKRVGYTLDLIEKDVEFDVISKELYKRIVKDIKISDKEAKEYFEENPEQFETKESREIAHILVKTKPEADAIYAQVKGGDEAVFTKLAKKSLDPSSKDTGGVLPGGAVQKGQTVPEFDKTSFELKTGETSQPVKTSYGWHVIQARGDVKKASTKKFDEVKGDIKKQVKGEQEGERYTEYNTDVRKDAEDDVKCRKGYVWKQTVTETEQAEEPPPAATEEAAPEKGAPPAEDAPKGDEGAGAGDEAAPAEDDAAPAGDEKAADEEQ